MQPPINTPIPKQLTEFIENLRVFVMGEYLSEADKKWWEPPVDPAAVTELAQVLFDYVVTVQQETTVETVSIAQVTNSLLGLYQEIESVNQRYHYALVEPEEAEELDEILRTFWCDSGLGTADIGALPRLADFDPYDHHTECE